MKKLDLKILAKYGDKYIALPADSSRIITAGDTIEELEKKLAKLKIKDAVIRYIAPLDKFLSPVCR